LTFFHLPIDGEGYYGLSDWDQSRRRSQRAARTRGFGAGLTACALGKSPKQTSKDVIRIAGMLVFISGKLRKNLADLSNQFAVSECSEICRRHACRYNPTPSVREVALPSTMRRWPKIICAAVIVALLLASTTVAAYLFISFQRGNKLATEGYHALALGDYDTAIVRFSAALQENIGGYQRAFVYLNRGAAYNSKWRYNESIADHTEALRLNRKLSDAYAGRGWAYLRKNEMDKAIADLSEAIDLDPNSQSAYYNRALILLQRSEFNQALANLNEAVRCDPKNVNALIVRGLCYVARNNLDQALASFDGAIVTAPLNAMAYIQRSKLYSHKGERDKQERDYQQALRLDPNIERASNEYLRWFGEKQWELWASEFAAQSERDPHKLFQEAAIAEGLGGYDRAIAVYNAILAMTVDPARASVATMNRGNAYKSKNDLDKALDDYNQAIALDPKNGGAFVNRALILSRQGKRKEAMEDYNEAVQLNPQLWQAYFNRAAELKEGGKLREALADLDHVTKLNPKFVGTYMNRANIHARQGQLDKAISDYNVALQLDPGLAEVYVARAGVLMRKKDYLRALSDLQRAAHAKSEKLDIALNSLAWFRATCPEARMRNGKEAVELATKACEFSQWKDWGNIDTLAAAYAEAGNFDKAIKYERQVIKMIKSSVIDSKIRQRLTLYEQHKPYREGGD
jgi:tetratricopeptide (TPR) repeat protein